MHDFPPTYGQWYLITHSPHTHKWATGSIPPTHKTRSMGSLHPTPTFWHWNLSTPLLNIGTGIYPTPHTHRTFNLQRTFTIHMSLRNSYALPHMDHGISPLLTLSLVHESTTLHPIAYGHWIFSPPNNWAKAFHTLPLTHWTWNFHNKPYTWIPESPLLQQDDPIISHSLTPHHIT